MRGGNADLTYLKLLKQFVGLFHDRSGVPRNTKRAERRETGAKAWISVPCPVVPPPPKGNISKCNKQRT